MAKDASHDPIAMAANKTRAHENESIDASQEASTHKTAPECGRRQKMFKIIFLWEAITVEGKMPYSPNHKQDTRRRILRSAARLFNRRGFSEATIDEIMIAAGLTHGGFYRHFSSKDKLYAEAVRYFLCKDAPEPWQRAPADVRKTDQLFARFIVDAYLSRDHLDDRDGSCPLIGLPSDVAQIGRASCRER